VISPARAVAASVSATIVTSASATPNPVTGNSTILSVLGTSPAGEASLAYTWSVLSGPAGTVSAAGANGTNAGKNVTAGFSQPGDYVFQVQVASGPGVGVTSQVQVHVPSIASSVAVSPTNASVAPGASQSFTAVAEDQFGAPVAA